MRAVRFHGERDVRVEELDGATPGPDEVRLEVVAAGICGSDLHQYRHGSRGLTGDDPHPLTGETLPVRMGHEFCGTVVETGADVTAVGVGETVVVNPILACESCRYCADGLYHLCEVGGFIGLSGGDGGFAEQCVVPAGNVVPFPDGLPAEHGALVEPFSVGVHAVRNSTVRPGDSVAVFGSGPVGLAIVQAVSAAGAGEVFVSEPRAVRRELAGDTGADVTIDPGATDPVERIGAATGGGVDVALEASGSEPGLDQALSSTRRRGEVSVVGAFDGRVSVQPMLLLAGERSVTGSLAYAGGPNAEREFGTTIGMFETSELEPEPLITDRIALDDIVEDGFEALLREGSPHVKILVEP